MLEGPDLHVSVTPSFDPVGGTAQPKEPLRNEFLELLVGVPVCAGRPELVSKVGSWFVVFVVDRVNTLAGIGQVGNGGLDGFLARELVEALVCNSGESLRAVGLVVANDFVEFLNVDGVPEDH